MTHGAHPTIVVIGAAGEVARVAVRTLLRHQPGYHLVLTDINMRSLEEFAMSLPDARVTARRLDLFDVDQARDTIRGAAMVINGAGPFARTAEPVIKACVAERVDYLDYDDDPASTLAAIGAEAMLAASGIRCFKDCGHSPGFTNVLAVDVANELDEVESFDVCWALGDEGPHVYGRAVIEHWLEVIQGSVPTWRTGRATAVEAFQASETYPLAGSLGNFRLYEVGHPEPITLPRRFPHAAAIRCMGGLHPQPVNGLSRGIADAVKRQAITMDEAIGWAQRVFNDQSGPLKVWRHAVAGIRTQYRRGEISGSELREFIWMAARKRHWAWRGAAAVKATGIKDGKRLTLMRRTPAPGPQSSMWTSLANCTGVSCAAFASMALTGGASPHGLLFPEDWAEPLAFYHALIGVGVREEDVIEPLIRVSATPVTVPT